MGLRPLEKRFHAVVGYLGSLVFCLLAHEDAVRRPSPVLESKNSRCIEQSCRKSPSRMSFIKREKEPPLWTAMIGP